MNPLSRVAARVAAEVVDRAIGLPPAAVPYVVRRDVAVPMPDGVVLLADHYRPAGAGGPLPVVLIRSPYGRGSMAALLVAAPLARRGFQVFVQSTRGTFGSGGHARGTAGADLAAWGIRQRPARRSVVTAICSRASPRGPALVRSHR
jgi:predicted acyl esterase